MCERWKICGTGFSYVIMWKDPALYELLLHVMNMVCICMYVLGKNLVLKISTNHWQIFQLIIYLMIVQTVSTIQNNILVENPIDLTVT